MTALMLGDGSEEHQGGGCCEHCLEVDVMRSDVAVCKAILERIEGDVVRRGEFEPVKLVSYGLVGLMALSFVAAIATAIFK